MLQGLGLDPSVVPRLREEALDFMQLELGYTLEDWTRVDAFDSLISEWKDQKAFLGNLSPLKDWKPHRSLFEVRRWPIDMWPANIRPQT